ncbi:MAG: hypothetical protein CR994_00445 [Maribacter sp.]|nr:MAG: hypothetical protein CR994_00445 [Maribacter sp.]
MSLWPIYIRGIAGNKWAITLIIMIWKSYVRSMVEFVSIRKTTEDSGYYRLYEPQKNKIILKTGTMGKLTTLLLIGLITINC